MDIIVPSRIISSYTCLPKLNKPYTLKNQMTHYHLSSIATIKHILLSPYELLYPSIAFSEKSPLHKKSEYSVWLRDSEFIPVIRNMPYDCDSRAMYIELFHSVPVLSNELRSLTICSDIALKHVIEHQRQRHIHRVINDRIIRIDELSDIDKIDTLILSEDSVSLSVKQCVKQLKIGSNLVLECNLKSNADRKTIIYNLGLLFFDISFYAPSVRNPYQPVFFIVLSGYCGTLLSDWKTYQDNDFDSWFAKNMSELQNESDAFLTRAQSRSKWIDPKKGVRYNSIQCIKWCRKYDVPVNLFFINSPKNEIIKDTSWNSKSFANEPDAAPWTTVEGQYSVIYASHAETMIRIIRKHLPEPLDTYTITDATANVGGFVLIASKYFKTVNAIELSPVNMEALEHNVQTYKRENVNLILGDCTNKLDEIQQDVIFIDPPWGGTFGYADDSINIELSGFSMADLVNKYRNTLFVLRLPKNFAFNTFITNVTKRNMKIYNIANYYLIIL